MLSKKDIKKILVIRNDKIGDLVISSGIFRALKRNFPGAKLTVVASNANKEIIEKNENIDKIITLESTPRSFSSLLKYIKLSKELRKEKFDIGLDLRGSFFNTLFLLYFGKVRYKIGFYEQVISRHFLDFAMKRDKRIHELDLIKKLAEKGLNLKLARFYPEIQVSIKDKRAANKFIKKNRIGKFICIVPEASAENRQWPLDNFDKVIKEINRENPSYKILLMGTDKEKIDYLYKRNTLCLPIIKANLRLVYLLFKKSDLVIALDGGATHLAWAANANLISIMAKGLLIEHIRPLGRNSAIIVGDINKIDVGKVIRLKRKMLR